MQGLPAVRVSPDLTSFGMQEGRRFFQQEGDRVSDIGLAVELRDILGCGRLQAVGFTGRNGQRGMDLALLMSEVGFAVESLEKSLIGQIQAQMRCNAFRGAHLSRVCQ